MKLATVQATRSDLKLPGWLPAPVRPRAAAKSEPIRVVIVGAVLTDILLGLLGASRAAASRRLVTRRIPESVMERRLRVCEGAWEHITGEALSTPAFYDRFCAGEVNTRFGARWAKYYEATLARPRSVSTVSAT
jgi:hypothetical protein